MALQASVNTADKVDDFMKDIGLDSPEFDLSQTLEQNMKTT